MQQSSLFPEVTEPTPAKADPEALLYAIRQIERGITTLAAQGYDESTHAVSRIRCGLDLLKIDTRRREFELGIIPVASGAEVSNAELEYVRAITMPAINALSDLSEHFQKKR